MPVQMNMIYGSIWFSSFSTILHLQHTSALLEWSTDFLLASTEGPLGY